MPLYFVAILAPQHINEKVIEWKQYMLVKFGCKVALRSPAHITLIPPFNMSREREEDLLQTLKYCSEQNDVFQIELNGFSAFKPRVIFVNVVLTDALARLKRQVEEFVYEAGYPIKVETRPFHPHVTIANRDLERKDFPMAWEHFKDISYEDSFPADKISLLRSEKEGWKVVK